MKDNLKLLVGVDGSSNSTLALMEAISIAKKFSGHIKVITVYKQENKDDAEKTQLKAKQLLEQEKVDCSLEAILGSNPSRALIDTATNENFDLIVVGSRGLGSAVSFLIGSVSKQVASKANCNVLVVKK
jgi:nucleotide-binding universal stress UspA family protein